MGGSGLIVSIYSKALLSDLTRLVENAHTIQMPLSKPSAELLRRFQTSLKQAGECGRWHDDAYGVFGTVMSSVHAALLAREVRQSGRQRQYQRGQSDRAAATVARRYAPRTFSGKRPSLPAMEEARRVVAAAKAVLSEGVDARAAFTAEAVPDFIPPGERLPVDLLRDDFARAGKFFMTDTTKEVALDVDPQAAVPVEEAPLLRALMGRPVGYLFMVPNGPRAGENFHSVIPCFLTGLYHAQNKDEGMTGWHCHTSTATAPTDKLAYVTDGAAAELLVKIFSEGEEAVSASRVELFAGRGF